MKTLRLSATHMVGRQWAVRPVGCSGKSGNINGKNWTVQYVTAANPKGAVNKVVYGK